jgi:hypothetical protein
VTLDANKTTMRFTEGIYIYYVLLNIHKSTATFTILSNYVHQWGSIDRVIAGTWIGNDYNLYCWVFLSDWWWYIKLWINPTADISNLSYSKIRFVKIA